MKREQVRKVQAASALMIALSASLMSFEFRNAEETVYSVPVGPVDIVEQDTMVIVKYDDPPELPKPKAGPPKPSPDPTPAKPSPKLDPNLNLDFVDSTNWFSEEETGEPDPVFIPTLFFASEMPTACSCEAGDYECTDAYMMSFFAKNLRYPQRPKDMGIDGKVYVDFIINEFGQVTKVKARNSVHPDLEQEAVRVVGSLGCFNPGKQGDKTVRVQYTAPIEFKLRP